MQDTDKIQEFSGFDTVSSFALLLGVIILVLGLVGHAMHQEKLTKAQVLSEQIAIRMLSVSDDLSPARRLASKSNDFVDKQDLDPWDRPFHYRKMLDANNRMVVVVYSAGPNGVINTKSGDFRINSTGRFIGVHFRGDDVGTVQKAWQ